MSVQLFQLTHAVYDRLHRHPLEIVALAAGQNGNRYLMHLCRRQNKNHIGRRFFKGLQQSIERRCREHMYLINDVDLVAPFRRRVFDLSDQLPHLFDAAVGCRVDLDHIHRIARSDRRTGRALSAGAAILCRMLTVDGSGKNPRHRRLSRAARAGKQIRVPDTVCMQLVFQSPDDMLLPLYIIKGVRAVPPV